MIQIEVAVAAPVRQTYTYILPEALADLWRGCEPELIGRRVFVPFGAGKATGYVLAVFERDNAPFTLKPVIDVIDDGLLFHRNTIPLFRWIAEYYHHPIGNVIKTALPAGLSTTVSQRLRLTKETSSEHIRDKFAGLEDDGLIECLTRERQLSPVETRRLLKKPEFRRAVQMLAKEGRLAVEKEAAVDRVGKKMEICYRLADSLQSLGRFGESDEQSRADSALNLCRQIGYQPGKADLRALGTIAELQCQTGMNEVPYREFRQRYPQGKAPIKRLVEAGLLQKSERRIYRSPFGDLLPRYEKVTAHTDDQQNVLRHIGRWIEKRNYRTFLLHGVTGSGKTEVYLEAAEQTIAMGRGVLVLVPEIALATQIEAHFVSRFGDQVAILHSGLSAGERYDEWSRILCGEAPVVIGARSAVFAPLPDCGLIIVDEEHDASFKQDDGLRYNGRDVAVYRGRLNEAVVLLGSATPAVTSYLHSSQGKYERLEMPARVGGKPLPEVTVVDLKKRSAGGKGNLFHEELSSALKENFFRGKQSILLLNRRGFSTSVVCLDCGTMVECRHCKVTLNLHKKRKLLLCHYCGFQLPENVICAVCGSGRLAPVGFGTERVSAELTELLPEARIARLDSDIAGDRREFLRVLQDVRTGEIDVLVGTQMIAKGLHFPEVTLVGIVLADSGLAFPDYRAAEKTYQLIAQVTGRAGRGDSAGRVIIQTMQPDHYAIALASRHDYTRLAEIEIGIRRQAQFPPFARLVFILVTHEAEQQARSQATEIAAEARQWCRRSGQGSAVVVLGPAPAPIERIRDLYRWQVLIKGTSLDMLHQLIDHLIKLFQGTLKERMLIDVDPENMM